VGPSYVADTTGGEELSGKFAKSWEGDGNGVPFTVRLRNSILPRKPVKDRINRAIRMVEMQIKRMDSALSKFYARDRALFNQIVDAYMQRDLERARALANELSEMRKTEKTMLYSKLALEQVAIRLRTVSEVGSFVSVLDPVTKVLRGLRSQLVGVVPDTERALMEINSVLSEVMANADYISEVNVDFEASSEDAQRILNEAIVVAEQRMREKLPELPADLMNGEPTKTEV